MVRRLARRIPEAEDVLELQPEELGGVILRAIVEDGGQVHLHNFINGLRQTEQIYPRSFTDQLEEAIGEAWAADEPVCLASRRQHRVRRHHLVALYKVG